jgi:magnesium chelatase family protein
MSAKALPSILPPLSHEEMLEVTQLHSLANHDYERIITQRPYRAPHHSASQAAVTGGGSTIRPGEISLAHRGVLFLDELPEFGRAKLEALRQPLEDRVISIARTSSTIEYPADFILVATANPCPCGYYGSQTGKDCSCSAHIRLQYQRRLSGPILDRIDLYSDVSEVDHDRLLTQPVDPVSDAERTSRIATARAWQAARYGHPSKLNAAMTNADIKRWARITPTAIIVLNDAARFANISARSYMRAIKVARTIADLELSETIKVRHISEALRYRRPVETTDSLPLTSSSRRLPAIPKLLRR